jgi:hypothetical protein
VIELVKLLVKEGMIEMKIGYRTGKKKYRTRIWPTELFLDMFKPLPNSVILNPAVEVVELTDEKGKLIEYRDTQRTGRIRAILTRANKVNEEANIQIHLGKDPTKLHVHLHARFKRKFTLHGRLYSKGYYHYQQFDEEDRAGITIDGEPVVELDYSGLHPRLLYAQKGIQFNGDPYSIINPDPKVRPFLKIILLALLNNNDMLSAERAANYWLFQNHREREILNTRDITKARPLIEEFEKVHKPIAEYFCSGKETGLRIMNLDSKIALEVVDHFVKQGRPILAIHDSFLVEERYEKELRKVMEKTYQKYTGGFTCKIN